MNVKYMYSLLAVIVLFLVSYVLAGTGTAFKVLFGMNYNLMVSQSN